MPISKKPAKHRVHFLISAEALEKLRAISAWSKRSRSAVLEAAIEDMHADLAEKGHLNA